VIPNIRTNFCPNCEAQANTIEELRSANERWAIAFKLAAAEERAKIVAWLRSRDQLEDCYSELQDDWLSNRIEAGEHETFTRSSDM